MHQILSPTLRGNCLTLSSTQSRCLSDRKNNFGIDGSYPATRPELDSFSDDIYEKAGPGASTVTARMHGASEIVRGVPIRLGK